MPNGDPSLYYGNQYPDETPMYGDSQANLTGMRASYGDVPAYMMSGAGVTMGGAASGVRNMFTDLGSMIRPVSYTPPARVNVGYYGQTAQQTGFFRGLTGLAGFNEAPRGVPTYDYNMRNASDFGERVGGGLAAGASTAAGLAFGATVGSVAGGVIGGFLGAPLGPVGAAAGAWIGKNIGGYVVGAMGADAVNEGVAGRRQISNFLESTSFRYVGAGSAMADVHMGSGMDRTSRQKTVEMIRGMDIADPTMATEDLTKILEQGSQLGMFTGVNNIESFKKKFKDLVDGVKTVTKTFQTTLEEGVKILKDFKGIGVDAGRVPELANITDSIGRATGRTAQEVMGLGMQGAEMFRGTGVEMKIGYQANIMNLASVRASRDAQLLSQEAVAQAGGEEALAARMTASGLQFAQTSLGRGFSAAFFGPKGFDQNAFREMTMGGKYDYNAFALQAVKNIGTPEAQIAYTANQEKFMSEAGKRMGGMGLQMVENTEAMSRAKFLVDSGATSNMQDALRFAFKESGKSDAEIDLRVASMKNARGEFSVRQAAASATRDRGLVDEAQSNFFLFRAKDAVLDTVKSVSDAAVVRPMSNLVDRVSEGTTNFYEKQALGLVTADLRSLDYEAFTGTLDLDPSAVAQKEKAINIDVGGALGKSAGEKLLGSIKSGELSAFGLQSRLVMADKEARPGEVILEREVSGRKRVVTRGALERAVRESATARMNVSEAQKMQEEGKLKGIDAGLTKAWIKGAVNEDSTIDQVAQATFGKDLSKLSREEYGSLLLEAQSFPEMKKLLDKTRAGALSLQTVDNAIAVAEHTKNLEDVETARESASKRLDMELTPEVFGKLSLAKAKRSRDPQEADRLVAEAVKLQSAEAQRAGIFNSDTTTDIVKVASRFMEEDSFNKEAGTVQRAAGSIAKVQRGLAFKRIAGSLDVDFKTTTLSKDEQGQVQGLVKRLETEGVQGLVGMSEKEIELLDQTDTGRAVVHQREVVKRIASLKDNKEILAATDPEKRKELFKKGMSGLGIEEKQLAGLTDTFVNRSASAAADQSISEFASDIVGKVVKAAPSGGLPETAKGSAEEGLQLQMNINLQILAALQALSTKLK